MRLRKASVFASVTLIGLVVWALLARASLSRTRALPIASAAHSANRDADVRRPAEDAASASAARDARREANPFAVPDRALSREVFYAEISDAELGERVEQLEQASEQGRQKFLALSEQRRTAIERGDPIEGERLFREMITLIAARRSLASALTDAAFERTCRALADCGPDARTAFFSSEE